MRWGLNPLSFPIDYRRVWKRGDSNPRSSATQALKACLIVHSSTLPYSGRQSRTAVSRFPIASKDSIDFPMGKVFVSKQAIS